MQRDQLDIIQAMAEMQQYSFVCAPSMAQSAALACPLVDLGPYIDRYKEKRDLMVSLLQQGFDLSPADGAFYLWVKSPRESATAFVEEAIAKNVLIILAAFSVNEIPILGYAIP